MVVIRSPETAQEFMLYYDLRYRILRKPWSKPKGSEKDSTDGVALHLMALDGDRVVAVGRLHSNNDDEGQIQYMAVDDDYKDKGIGSRILKALEREAVKRRAKSIVIDARQNTVKFYKNHGYKVVCPSQTLFGEVANLRMKKKLKRR
jgi:predicted GNAT family N-acyltransferase